MPRLGEATNATGAIKKWLSTDDVDPYRYDYMIKRWAADTDAEVSDDPTYDDLTKEDQKSFIAWLEDHYDDLPVDEQDPNRYFNSPGFVSPSTWLIHFSDDARSIVDNGFLYGAYEDSMHLTKYRKPDSGPIIFAFIAGTRDADAAADDGKYGDTAVMFQSSAAITAWHVGDEENQVIIDKSDLKPRNLTYLYKLDSDTWAVGPEDHPYAQGSIRRVSTWVENNSAQYHHHLYKENLAVVNTRDSCHVSVVNEDNLPRQGNVKIFYAGQWKKSLKRLQRGLEPLIKDSISDFVLNFSAPKYRFHSLIHFSGYDISSADLFHYRGTVYKVIFKRKSNEITFIWIGSHEAYNKLTDFDWIKNV
jgi:hypothetical protein